MPHTYIHHRKVPGITRDTTEPQNLRAPEPAPPVLIGFIICALAGLGMGLIAASFLFP